jgi:hypothetical protein
MKQRCLIPANNLGTSHLQYKICERQHEASCWTQLQLPLLPVQDKYSFQAQMIPIKITSENEKGVWAVSEC